MPTAQILVRQANGQTLVLSGDDRIVKEVTIECSSQRCASRHGQPKPVEFTFDDQGAFPESGDQFLSLILPERSPSNPQYPLPFCGPTCLKDFLTYQYFAPGPRQPLTAEQLTGLNSPEFDAGGPPNIRKTDNPEAFPTDSSPVAQADGAGE